MNATLLTHLDAVQTTEDARMAAAKGAVCLDEKEPAWYRIVNVATLRMNSCAQCVLGQLSAPSQYQDALLQYDLSEEDAVTLGFELPESVRRNPAKHDMWTVLRSAWIDEIDRRLYDDHAAGRL